MPELPEVEVLRRDLERDVVGKKIKAVETLGLRSIRRHKSKKEFASLLVGRKVVGVERKGKYLLLVLDEDQVLVIHLGMSGQLIRSKGARDASPKHTHVVITFTQGGALKFVDPRTFGELFVSKPDEVADKVPELRHLGFDPIEAPISWAQFGHMLAQHHTRLKTLLMDQTFVSGIGNIYSDEILFAAGLRWDRMSDDLSPQELRRLSRAMVEVLQDAVKHRGSTLADEQFVDLAGSPGEFQAHHCVYAREGQACRRCRHTIVRKRVSGRSTYLCEACQV